MANKQYTDYQELLLEELQNPELALAYLNEALMDDDQRVFLLALKDVFAAWNGNISDLAQVAHINRQNVHRIFSKEGNPTLNSLKSILNAMGLQLQLASKK